MKDYEGLFIIKPTVTDEAAKKLSTQIDTEITKNGGKVEAAEHMGKRGLGYSVKKYKEGIYYKVDFKIEPGKISELTKIYKLNEDILRATILNK